MGSKECKDHVNEVSQSEATEVSGEPAISEIASQSFDDDVALHRVVTFLNKSLRRRGFIFGLTRERDNELRITIYEVENAKL